MGQRQAARRKRQRYEATVIVRRPLSWSLRESTEVPYDPAHIIRISLTSSHLNGREIMPAMLVA